MQHRAPSAPTEETLADPVERILGLWRAEWRSGFPNGPEIYESRRYLENLTSRTMTGESASTLRELITAMDGYRFLNVGHRREKLEWAGKTLRALVPHLRPLNAAPANIGKLNSAVAPGRAQANTEPKPKPAAKPTRFTALSPDDSITNLPQIGSAMAGVMAQLDIETLGDLLDHAPRRHIDYSRTVQIKEIFGFGPLADVTIRGTIAEVREHHAGGRLWFTIRIADDTGSVKLTTFNRYLARDLGIGEEVFVSGRPEYAFGDFQFEKFELEKVGKDGLSTGRLTPIYPLTKGLTQKTVRKHTRAALDATKGRIVDPLPEAVLLENRLVDLWTAYDQLHYPDNPSALGQARRRLSFSELLYVTLRMEAVKRGRLLGSGNPFTLDAPALREFRAVLPFALTGAQERVVHEILNDVQRPHPMARLLQGDVGSGKTVVAAVAALAAARSGYQTALMAPTEILADQHFFNLQGLYGELPAAIRPRVGRLTGKTSRKDRTEIHAALESGEIDVLVGTHALIVEQVAIPNLGLSIVDEQHRFGVRQRLDLANKAGVQPHVLSMTATPIPRTLNLVLFSDLDISVIDERPPGRKPIITRAFLGGSRAEAEDLIRSEIKAGRQVFVICPLVEESDAIEAKAAVAEAERLQQEVFPEFRIYVIHGRMSGKAKDAIMTRFRDREFDILVSTTVIEVGIDIPNASVIMIEGADRFGLAQLHQLRGRVGRGADQSHCLLVADDASAIARERLEMMVATDNGFVLAEKDLEIRGPGDFLGTQQSGFPPLPWVKAAFNSVVLDEARRAAMLILDRDPDLAQPVHRTLRHELDRFWSKIESGPEQSA